MSTGMLTGYLSQSEDCAHCAKASCSIRTACYLSEERGAYSCCVDPSSSALTYQQQAHYYNRVYLHILLRVFMVKVLPTKATHTAIAIIRWKSSVLPKRHQLEGLHELATS